MSRGTTMRGFVVLCLALMPAACSKEQLYASGQAWRSSRCQSLPQVQQAACEEEARKPYWRYEQERVEETGPGED